MPRFFYSNVPADTLVLVGEDAQHIGRVLRMKVGDELTISCEGQIDCDCVIEEITGSQVVAKTVKQYKNESEPSIELTLYQALPKSDKMDLIVQKAVELGATTIVPMLTKRCVSRPDAKAMKKKCERFQKIAKEAAKQSGRGKIPEIKPLMTFEQVIEQSEKHDSMILCYENGGKRLNDLLVNKPKSIGLMIGSEGGFETEEVEKAQQNGVQTATLGKLILRCETAPLTAISIIMNLTRNI